MKYDILNKYKKQLFECQELSENTAKKYYSAIVKLLNPLQFNNISEIDASFIEQGIKQFKTKNEFSAVKNGLIHLKKIYPEMTIPNEETFKSISQKKRNYSKKPKKKIYYDEVKRKINQISNNKLKYAYRLALISGLRVDEIAHVEEKDLEFKDGTIYVTVTHGKGGHNGKVECMKDDYLYEHLKNFADQNPSGNLFYSEEHMRGCADKLGIECHDLRRIFAITFRNEIRKEIPIIEANALTQEKLRHARFSTTKRYLFNRKLVIKRRRGEENGRQSG